MQKITTSFIILVALLISSNLCLRNRWPLHPRMKQWLAKEEAEGRWDPWNFASSGQHVQQGSSNRKPIDPWGLAKEEARFNPHGYQPPVSQPQNPGHHYNPAPPNDYDAPPTQNTNPGNPVQQPSPPQGDTNTNTPNQASTGVKYKLTVDSYGGPDFMVGSIYQEQGSNYLGKWDLMTIQQPLLSGIFHLNSDSRDYFLVAQRLGTTLEASIYDINMKMVGTASFPAHYGNISDGSAIFDTSNPEPLFRIEWNKQSGWGDYYIQINSKRFVLGDVMVWLAMQDRYFGNIIYKNDQSCRDNFQFDSSNGDPPRQFTITKQYGCKKPRVFGQSDDYTLKAVKFKETDQTWTYGQEPMYPY